MFKFYCFFFCIIIYNNAFGFQKDIVLEEEINVNLKDYALVFTSNKIFDEPTLDKEFTYFKDRKSFFYFNFNQNTIWLQFKLKNSLTIQKKVFVKFSNAMINEIIAYKKIETELKEISKSGIKYPLKSRSEENRNFTFSILINPNEESFFILQLNKKKGRPLVTDINIVDYKSLNESELKEYIIIGIYTGLSFIFFIIGLYLFVILKNTMYLHYSMYLLFLCLFLLSYTGVFQQYFLPSNSILNKYYHYVIFSEISLVFFVIFSQKYLETKTYLPKLYKIVRVLLVFVVVLRVLLHFFFDKLFREYIPFFMKIWYAILLVGMIAVAYQIIILTRKKRVNNKLFAIAYFIMIIGSAIMVLYHSSGYVNGVFFNLPLLLFTSLLEIVIISFALALSVKKVLNEKQILIGEVALEKEKNLTEAIFLNNKTKVYLKDLMYVKSDGNYIQFYLKNDKILDRNKMKVIEDLLPANFVRIHKSYIINKNYIKATNSNSIIINSDVEIPLSRHYKKNL